MKKKIIMLGIVVLLICVGLTGCMDEKSKFIGEWKDQDGDTHHFFSDGNFNTMTEGITQSGAWEIKDNKLVINVPEGTVTYSYTFSNSDKTLTLSGPKTLVLEKQ